jgi:hypothetical protein
MFSLFCGKNAPFAEFCVSRNSPFQGSERNSATKNFFSHLIVFFVLEWLGKDSQTFFLWLGTNSKCFSLLLNGSERNSELFLSSAERLGTEFPTFSVLQNRRNSEE